MGLNVDATHALASAYFKAFGRSAQGGGAGSKGRGCVEWGACPWDPCEWDAGSTRLATLDLTGVGTDSEQL